MQRFAVGVGLLLLFVLPFTAVTAPHPEQPLGVTVSWNTAGDTARAIARWAPAPDDGNGPIDGYVVAWRFTPPGTVQRNVTVTGTVDTVYVPLPPLPDSVIVNVRVWSTRNSVLTGPSSDTRVFKRPLTTIPPAFPGPVRIDTVAAIQPFPAILNPATDSLSGSEQLCNAYLTVRGVRGLFFTTTNPTDTLSGIHATPLNEPRYDPCLTAFQRYWGPPTGPAYFALEVPFPGSGFGQRLLRFAKAS